MVRKQLYGICIEGRSSHLRWRYPIRWTATDVTEWSGLYSDLRSPPSLARFLETQESPIGATEREKQRLRQTSIDLWRAAENLPGINSSPQ